MAPSNIGSGRAPMTVDTNRPTKNAEAKLNRLCMECDHAAPMYAVAAFEDMIF